MKNTMEKDDDDEENIKQQLQAYLQKRKEMNADELAKQYVYT